MNKLIIACSVFCVLFLFACSGSEKNANSTQSIRPVKYINVGQSDRIGQHSYTGLAKAQQEANLSFKVGGTINNIPVKVGDLVRKGQVLARLDATDYQVNYDQSVANDQNSKAQIGSAEAQLENAKSNLKTARSNYKRFEKLYENNSISISDFEQAKSSFLSADASFKAAEKQVEAAKAGERSSSSMVRSASNQVNYTQLKAPFSGIISRINVEENEVVGQGSPVIEINSVTNPDVEVGVSENAISEIKAQQKVKVQFRTLHDKMFEGVVHEIGYSSNASTYPVTIRLIESDERIRPGMPASAVFSFDDHHSNASALLVPPSSVGEDNEGNFVYTLVEEGEHYRCKKKNVKIGELSDNGFEIISGLSNGEKVAAAGLNVLRDDMLVSLYQKK
ncbi:MAG: efflux RND transporter periplasmic adaptor subunit [Saprospiraceae bacterium]|nr:efflux RND transporter periplasmic adaptor subunit [Saprospiraceae bacterium]